MPTERRLAAIMFTDIVGYTALMAESADPVAEPGPGPDHGELRVDTTLEDVTILAAQTLITERALEADALLRGQGTSGEQDGHERHEQEHRPVERSGPSAMRA